MNSQSQSQTIERIQLILFNIDNYQQSKSRHDEDKIYDFTHMIFLSPVGRFCLQIFLTNSICSCIIYTVV